MWGKSLSLQNWISSTHNWMGRWNQTFQVQRPSIGSFLSVANVYIHLITNHSYFIKHHKLCTCILPCYSLMMRSWKRLIEVYTSWMRANDDRRFVVYMIQRVYSVPKSSIINLGWTYPHVIQYYRFQSNLFQCINLHRLNQYQIDLL